MIVYIVSPFAVGALWWLNQRTDSGEPLPGEPLVPRSVLLVQTFFVAVALLLVGAARAWSDFDTGNVLTYLYVGGLAAQALALAVLYRRMARQRPYASGGAPRRPLGAARARPGA